jgi:hypothetical protein
MSFDPDTTLALIAVLASALYLLRGTLVGGARLLARSRPGPGPAVCKGCGGGGCKASPAPRAGRGALIQIERGPGSF